jgi:ABC-type transporter MlaC component
MTRRTFLIAAVFPIPPRLSRTPPDEPGPDPGAFVSDIANRALAALPENATPAHLVARLRELLHHFDMPDIVRFMAAPYWLAIADQQAALVNLLEIYIALAYSSTLADYVGAPLEVISVRRYPEEGITSVASEVRRANGGPPLSIGWYVANRDGRQMVIDVILGDAGSLRLAGRKEIAGIVARNHNDPSAIVPSIKGLIRVIECKLHIAEECEPSSLSGARP